MQHNSNIWWIWIKRKVFTEMKLLLNLLQKIFQYISGVFICNQSMTLHIYISVIAQRTVFCIADKACYMLSNACNYVLDKDRVPYFREYKSMGCISRTSQI